MIKLNWNKKNFTCKTIFYEEIKNFFSPSSFIGIKQQFKNNNFFVVDLLSKRYIVTKTDKYNLLNNCCLHKGAKLINNESDIKRDKLICPIHYWTYNLDGKLIVAPYTDLDCKSLDISIKSTKEIFDFEFFLFSNKKITEEISSSKFLKDFNFSNYELYSYNVSDRVGNWKEYGIVFNDSNHVKFFHPEMTKVLDNDSIEWEFGENYSAHRLKYNPNWSNKKDNKFVKYFNFLISNNLSIKNDNVNDYAVTWVNIFPNVFIDLWANKIVIVYVEPTGLDTFRVHDFLLYNKDTIKNDEIINLFSSAMDIVESEDDEIIKKIHSGFLLNYENDIFTEYVVSPSENGDINFYEWLMKNGYFYIK